MFHQDLPQLLHISWLANWTQCYHVTYVSGHVLLTAFMSCQETKFPNNLLGKKPSNFLFLNTTLHCLKYCMNQFKLQNIVQNATPSGVYPTPSLHFLVPSWNCLADNPFPSSRCTVLTQWTQIVEAYELKWSWSGYSFSWPRRHVGQRKWWTSVVFTHNTLRKKTYFCLPLWNSKFLMNQTECRLTQNKKKWPKVDTTFISWIQVCQ